MSDSRKTLKFIDGLTARARELQAAGFVDEAARLLQRLAGFRAVPTAYAEEVQRRLGQIRLERGQYAKARRHLAAALAHQPFQARSHYLLAAATQGDDRANPQDALAHLRQAVACEPENADYLADLGLQAVCLGEVADGLTALRKAQQVAPDDPEILSRVAEGLRHAGHDDEARDLIRAARFRHPRDRRFAQLWNDFHFQALHDEQQAHRTRHEAADRDTPAVLPFVRAERGRRSLRKDSASSTHQPHSRARSVTPAKPPSEHG